MLDAVDRVLAPVTWIAAALTVLLLLVGPVLVAEDETAPAAAGGGASAQTAYDPAETFRASCGGCHTLSAAGTTGASGPALDGLALDAAAVEAAMREGPGSMPSFGDLGDEQLRQVADYVSRASAR